MNLYKKTGMCRGYFHIDEYKKDMYIYKKELTKYENMCWFKKLFFSKPILPNPQNYIW